MSGPRFDGHSLVNLVAELERRLTGSSSFAGLDGTLAQAIPDKPTYVFMLFDGLGAAQLTHPAARDLARSSIGALDAMFPTTTTVSMSTIATGLPPSQHGVIGHHMWIPELAEVVNVLKWILPGGPPVEYPTETLLPSPNVWERLAAAGIEPITVQPGAFESSPLSRALYRGCRIEAVWTEEEMAKATIDLASRPGRFIFTYMPHVDVAAHLFGQASDQYANALRQITTIWERVAHHLPDHVGLVGTADHGHVDYLPTNKTLISRSDAQDLTFFGDPRTLYVRGPAESAKRLEANLPATWIPGPDLQDWWGPEPPHQDFDDRFPTGALLANPGNLLLPTNMDRRLIGYHGGLEPDELAIPLLVH